MNVCFESANVLTSSVGTSSAPPHLAAETSIAQATPVNQSNTVVTNFIQQPVAASVIQTGTDKIEQVPPTKSIAKILVANHSPGSGGPVLQKVVNPPLITVLNPSGPLTVVKSICVTSGVSSASHFTFVNSTPLTVTNASVKSPTITLLNAPVTVVKAITAQQQSTDKSSGSEASQNVQSLSGSAPPVQNVIENRGHNVFVKNTSPDSAVQDIPQSHKLLTASNFPQTNVLASQQSKILNGQRNKLKIISNVVMPGSSQLGNNILLNKTNQQRFLPRPKLISPNGATAKYLNKTPNNLMKPSTNHTVKLLQDKPSSKIVYPTHKSHIKTLPPVNSYMQKTQQGVKTISPQHKPVPGQVQRTGSGLRTIPPQRTHKMPNKPNYIGKHAAQAQKMRQGHGKALTAQIIETLSNSSTPMPSSRYDMMPTRYDSAFSCPDAKQVHDAHKQQEEKSKSGLDALSLICQAVLLDHNYNATLPPDSPTRPSPPLNISSQVNGISAPSIYSPGTVKRRPLPSANILSAATNLSNISLTPGNGSSSLMNVQDDDAASDISDISDRKHDTEGEETDTAPEAEAVNNDNFDGYGDYVTRCICGFLHDDGYMVECDRCKVWQHVQCVVKNRQIPDEYLCEACDPTKPIDRQKARMAQQQWLRDRQFVDPKLRKDTKMKEAFKPKETISDTDSSDGEHVAHNNNVVNKNRSLASRRKSDNHQKQAISRQRREVQKEVVQRRQKRKERKIVRKKSKPPVKPVSEDENQDAWASHLPQLRQWIEKYEEAVTNHYSPELRARISSIRVNGIHSDASVQYDTTVHKCRVHTHPLTEIKFLVATVNLQPNTPVVELRGKYMLSTQHRATGGSLTTRQHSQRPGPFLFFYRLNKDNTEVCVDTRTYGNSARFVRRSCRPNAELRHCIEKGVLHIFIVSIAVVDRNCELTIKHESHDLAAIGTTRIACACGNQEECSVNKSTTTTVNTAVKKNGEAPELHSRKRRKRRTVSSNIPDLDSPKTPVEESLPAPPPAPRAPTPPTPLPSPPIEHSPVKMKIEKCELVVKPELVEEPMQVKEEPMNVETKVEVDIKEETFDLKTEEKMEDFPEPEEDKKTVKVKEEEDEDEEEELKSPHSTPASTRRSSHYKSDREDEKSDGKSDGKEEKKEKSKKLSREERKLEAILRAIEQMEKAESRKQEHQAKQAHRRESEPGLGPGPKEEEKQEPKMKRRRRKGRSRTISQSASRRNRLNSTDSYMTSGDENMLSPNDSVQQPNKTPIKECSTDNSDNRAVGLLLALSSCEPSIKGEKSPARDIDSNSNSAHSSPETPLSSACLFVQAAVEPLEQGFKFPKTKKGLMNEWLNKVPPEPMQTASAMSPSSLTPHMVTPTEDVGSMYSPMKSLTVSSTSADLNHHPRGSAKKRWLRQAISEDHSCDSPSSRPDSPPLSDMVAPPKKRRLPRQSLSMDSPPSTPTSTLPPSSFNNPSNERTNPEGCVEIVCNSSGGDSPLQTLESDAILKERAAKMKQEFGKALVSSSLELPRSDLGPLSCLDPRLSREGQIFNTDLVGTVEKTLSILGLENNKPELPTLPKRKVKLSITEYRQRKKLNTNDKGEDMETESNCLEETNSSESFKVTARARSASNSSSTSLTSSDDEMAPPEIITKTSAFNCEPTELERERELASLRLKKTFGLAVDGEPRPALNVEAILNLELDPPKMKPVMPLPSPTFPIPGSSSELVTRDVSTHPLSLSSPIDSCKSSSAFMALRADSPVVDVEEMETEEISVTDDAPAILDGSKESCRAPPNLFYTPDEEEVSEEEEEEDEGEEEEAQCEAVFEETENISYVPPFNNPVYPNESFTPFSSTIDDEARYEGRNPSPPPHLEKSEFEEQL
ncbi:SET domain-containing protein upSET isoform X3 [Leptinotarsa decemlineata]|uniref:SET domain-containing protein upSET isoform X3 n=1 Tax=Leptinotarsa decemlineata TaxID=7539 RepID=UPI003D309343